MYYIDVLAGCYGRTGIHKDILPLKALVSYMNSHVLIDTDSCIKKALHMLSMHRFDTLVPQVVNLGTTTKLC